MTVRRDGTGEVAVDDTVYPIATRTLQDARRTAAEIMFARAAQPTGAAVRAATDDPDGPCTLVVYPDGKVAVEPVTEPPAAAPPAAADGPPAADEAAPAAAEASFWPPGAAEESTWWTPRHAAPAVEPPAAATPAAGEAAPVPAAAADAPPAAAAVAAPPAAEPAAVPPAEHAAVPPAEPAAVPPAGQEPPATPVAPGRHARKSFIATEAPVEPAQVGVRGSLNRMGIRTGPSRKEQALRDDINLVSQHWAGPRTVAVANPKGSANKTPTTVCLSAIFARFGGGPVLAWDNNETRGTAAWRTGKGNHDATVLDLLPKTQDLLAVGAQAAELARYVHHQPADKFDVLWSDQSTEGEHEVTGEEVDAVHEVAAKYYRLVFMDSGNSERASNWRAMIRHAHSLVVPCTNVEDTAEAGARMLEALAQRDEHSAELARNAVAIISQRTPGNDPLMRRIVRDFAPLVRTVVTIPHDPALYSGVIRFDALRPATQRAWLAAGAAVAEGL